MAYVSDTTFVIRHSSFVIRHSVPSSLRTLLLLTLLVSLVGTLAELLLLEHFEDVWQWTPVVLLGAALFTLAG